jgi:hypothetical protein
VLVAGVGARDERGRLVALGSELAMGEPAPAVWGVPDVTQLIELSEQTVVAIINKMKLQLL